MLPDNNKAQMVTQTIRRLGIHDVMLFYDRQVKLWAVCQVKHVPQSIVTMDNIGGTNVQPMIMWWVRTPDGKYRSPGDQDITDVIATVNRAQVIFDKSKNNPDWLDDQMIKEEKEKKIKHDVEQTERLKYIARTTNLKKHIQRELGEHMQ